MATEPKDKDEESEARGEGYEATDVPHTQVEEGSSKGNDQRVESDSRGSKQDQEQADSVTDILLDDPVSTAPRIGGSIAHGPDSATEAPHTLSKESSPKEVGHADCKSSGTPQGSEQEKDQPGSAADASTPQYPGPLALSILVVGISLSVSLVSLDRTIITTVRLPGDHSTGNYRC